MRRYCSAVFILLSSIFFSSCALLEAPEQKKIAKKEIRDVSPKARKEEQGPRKRLLILPFLDEEQSRPQEFRSNARSELIKELNLKGRVIAMAGDDLDLKPDARIQNGEYQMTEFSKIALEKGFAALLEGKIIDLKVKHQSDAVGIFRQAKTRFDAVVRIRVFSARSTRELFNVTKTVTLQESNLRVPENATAELLIRSNPELLEKLIADAFLDFQNQIEQSLDRLSWEGRIALIRGDEVFLNVGRISGVQLGDILRVTEEGEEIFDPQTGNFIGKAQGRMKGTLEVVSYFGTDGAKTVIHSGAGFKENDRVELY